MRHTRTKLERKMGWGNKNSGTSHTEHTLVCWSTSVAFTVSIICFSTSFWQYGHAKNAILKPTFATWWQVSNSEDEQWQNQRQNEQKGTMYLNFWKKKKWHWCGSINTKIQNSHKKQKWYRETIRPNSVEQQIGESQLLHVSARTRFSFFNQHHPFCCPDCSPLCWMLINLQW